MKNNESGYLIANNDAYISTIDFENSGNVQVSDEFVMHSNSANQDGKLVVNSFSLINTDEFNNYGEMTMNTM